MIGFPSALQQDPSQPAPAPSDRKGFQLVFFLILHGDLYTYLGGTMIYAQILWRTVGNKLMHVVNVWQQKTANPHLFGNPQGGGGAYNPPIIHAHMYACTTNVSQTEGCIFISIILYYYFYFCLWCFFCLCFFVSIFLIVCLRIRISPFFLAYGLALCGCGQGGRATARIPISQYTGPLKV